LIFYGYSSVQPQALASAGLLRQFLEELVSFSPAIRKRMPKQRQNATHQDCGKLLIVAHSFGAALTRRALLDASSVGAAWPAKTSLLLFAPAHRGAQLAQLKKELAGSWKLFSLLSTLLTPTSQSTRDLEPASQFITKLSSDTMAALAQNPEDWLKAKQVIFGQKDAVALMERFCQDPLEIVWKGHNHTSVCKADVDFQKPLQEVLNQL
jgi:alpha-beta hydrolase superfamily lysophospholipase